MFFKLIKVLLLVSELYIYQNARCNDTKKLSPQILEKSPNNKFHYQTGSGAHPAYYTMGTGSFQGVKRKGRGVDHPPISSAEVKESG
jgi:hypothetical protein